MHLEMNFLWQDNRRDSRNQIVKLDEAGDGESRRPRAVGWEVRAEESTTSEKRESIPMRFTPPLAATLRVPDGPGVLTFALDAQLAQHEIAELWTDFPESEWHAVRLRTLNTEAQLSLAPHDSEAPTHEARITFRGLQHPAYGFTYRIRDDRDGSIRWLGDEHSNGTLLRAPPIPTFLLESPNWADDPHVLGARAWCGPLPSEVARFGGPSDLHAAHGFAITADR